MTAKLSRLRLYRARQRPWLGLLAVAMIVAATTATARAQSPAHLLYRGDMPSGMIGQLQLHRPGLAGYYQPVELRAPKGALVSLAVDCQFLPTESNIAAAGMLIGEVYRARIGNIAGLEGVEVYPSIELIGRLCPPPGMATRFPIPIELAQDDLELAAAGKYVTRIVYVEDPRNPAPEREIANQQRVYEARPSEDALRVADEIGRPIAIVRLGSRTPDVNAATGQFMFECPSLLLYERPTILTVRRDAGLETPLEGPPRMGRASRNFPRLPEGVQVR